MDSINSVRHFFSGPLRGRGSHETSDGIDSSLRIRTNSATAQFLTHAVLPAAQNYQVFQETSTVVACCVAGCVGSVTRCGSTEYCKRLADHALNR
jgi:hypothetical protein